MGYASVVLASDCMGLHWSLAFFSSAFILQGVKFSGNITRRQSHLLCTEFPSNNQRVIEVHTLFLARCPWMMHNGLGVVVQSRRCFSQTVEGRRELGPCWWWTKSRRGLFLAPSWRRIEIHLKRSDSSIQLDWFTGQLAFEFRALGPTPLRTPSNFTSEIEPG